MTDIDFTPMAWSGVCGDCGVTVIYAATVEMTEDDATRVEEGPDSDWDGFSICLICGDTIHWDGNDPTARILVREQGA